MEMVNTYYVKRLVMDSKLSHLGYFSAGDSTPSRGFDTIPVQQVPWGLSSVLVPG